jgi:ribulose-5-phosphate 4-epimerase/fuculose-1-phosphate aldolase
MNNWLEDRKTVLDTAREMCSKGLVVGNSGNISLRLPPDGKTGQMAITPTSRHYDTLDYDDIPIIDFNGKIVDGKLKPSIETPLHIAIYKARKNVNAVIHTHSVFASAVAVAGLDIPPILLDQVLFLGGEIKASGGALVTTPEQISSFIMALGDRSAALIPNHGAVGTGKTMRDAFTACELIEKTAQIYLLALGTGKVTLLPEDVIQLEKAAYDKLQGINR